MSQNILLTSLDVLENDRTLRYYSAEKASGFEYCETMQPMEASTKYILAHFPIDRILVIGEEETSSEGGDGMNSLTLRDAGALYAQRDPGALNNYELYCSRIVRYVDPQGPKAQTTDALVSEEEQKKLIDFIREFQQKRSKQESIAPGRLFDQLAGSRALYDQFKDELFTALPEARTNARPVMKWVKSYLYTLLKPSAKLQILPGNENVSIRSIPARMLNRREGWYSGIWDINQDVLDGKYEINLYVSLGNNSNVDPTLLLNMLDILISTPDSHVHLKKLYKVFESSGNLTGVIEDTTAVSGSSYLVAAARAFLNYSKTDMLADFWRHCGEQDDRISRLIHAARHVDVGISMCNIREVQEGIQQLRFLFKDERLWSEEGNYGLLFGIIADCIQSDYSPLLKGNGPIPFIELIKWAYQHQLYQQVLTLIESHAPSNLVNSGIFFYCDNEARKEEITRLFASQLLGLKSYEQYKMDDIDHYFIKTYDRATVRLHGFRGEDRCLAFATLRVGSIENPKPARINGHTVCSSMNTVKNVLHAYYTLGVVRNTVSHANSDAMSQQRGNASQSDTSSAMALMKKSIEYFITSYEKALAEVRNKRPNIVTISPGAVRSTADRLRQDKGPEARYHIRGVRKM